MCHYGGVHKFKVLVVEVPAVSIMVRVHFGDPHLWNPPYQSITTHKVSLQGFLVREIYFRLLNRNPDSADCCNLPGILLRLQACTRRRGSFPRALLGESCRACYLRIIKVSTITSKGSGPPAEIRISAPY